MIKNIYMPNIGNYESIIITNIMVSNGDKIKKNDKIITTESGKASIDIESPYSGIIVKVNIFAGKIVKCDDILFKIQIINETNNLLFDKNNTNENKIKIYENVYLYASPNVRRLARQLKLDLKNITKPESNQRITKNDLVNSIDYKYYGDIQKISLQKRKEISNQILLNSWKNIPHVTQFSELDISSLILLYTNEKINMKKNKIPLTLLPFIIKAITKALIQYPLFNSSLDNETEIILKKYYNIGIVTATKYGLITPVIKNVNSKSIFNLNNELLSNKKKIDNNKLMPDTLTGGSFSISNLGSYTSGFFTPIIKYPEVAILGVSRYKLKPVIQQNKEISLKTILPISLSYDHRVIDGLDCINFIKCFHKNLNEIKSIHNE